MLPARHPHDSAAFVAFAAWARLTVPDKDAHLLFQRVAEEVLGRAEAHQATELAWLASREVLLDFAGAHAPDFARLADSRTPLPDTVDSALDRLLSLHSNAYKSAATLPARGRRDRLAASAWRAGLTRVGWHALERRPVWAGDFRRSVLPLPDDARAKRCASGGTRSDDGRHFACVKFWIN